MTYIVSVGRQTHSLIRHNSLLSGPPCVVTRDENSRKHNCQLSHYMPVTQIVIFF